MTKKLVKYLFVEGYVHRGFKMAGELRSVCEGCATLVGGDLKQANYLFYTLLWLPLFTSLYQYNQWSHN